MNETSMLKKISTQRNSSIITYWNNDKTGSIEDINGDCCYRFFKADLNSDTLVYRIKFISEDEKEQLPVIACGFVGWLLQCKGCQGNDLDSTGIFEGYLTARLNMYREAHKDDPDLFKRDLEKEFYSIHKKQEKQLVEQSMAINEFLPDCDIRLIQTFVDCYFEYVDTKTGTATPQQKTTITIPDNILQELENAGYIENAAARPLKWIKPNRTTHGQTPNKKSLLDLLCLLGYPDSVIKDRVLLNSLFIFPNNKPLAAQNYTYLTDSKGQINRPIKSDYHSELENIVTKSKEK